MNHRRWFVEIGAQKQRWVHLCFNHSSYCCDWNSYASHRPYSAIRTKRFDLEFSPEGDGRVDLVTCHRPSELALIFFLALSEPRHFQQQTLRFYRSDHPSKFCLPLKQLPLKFVYCFLTLQSPHFHQNVYCKGNGFFVFAKCHSRLVDNFLQRCRNRILSAI